MARSIGSRIPLSVLALLSGEALEQRIGLTFLLLSATADGWPHLAMLSVGEVVAPDDGHLRLALWPASTAAGNLARDGRATLSLVHEGAGYSVRLGMSRGPDLVTPLGGTLARFEAEVQDVLEDVAPYAVLETGVHYRLKDPDAVLVRWRETVAALKG